MTELTFASKDDLLSHYKAVSARLNAGPRHVVKAPPMVPIEQVEAAALEATPKELSVDEALSPFVVGPSNLVAFTMLRRLLLDDLPGRLLYIYGPEGCGKTLLATLARDLLPAPRLRLTDNAHTAALTECQRVMGGLIRGLAFGQHPPADCIGGHALSRAVVVEIEPPCAAVQSEVLRREAHRLGVASSPAARDVLLQAGASLPAALGMLRTFAMIGAPITPEGVMAMVGAACRPPEPRTIRVGDIQRIVCQHFGVSLDDMASQRRTANVVRPRQIAMYLAKTLTLRSLPEIGRRFGGRDHTTVLHAVRKFEAITAECPDVADEIAMLSERIADGVRS